MAETLDMFSPHAWGWTEIPADDPALKPFSPHAWGWTGGPNSVRFSFVVFPTRVGVDRRFSYFIFSFARFPHTRGGGPG